MGMMQSLLRVVYPPHCILCSQVVEDDNGLCSACWRDTPFVTGLVCDLCGAPLPGEDPGGAVHCDVCRRLARPWSRGRAALVYRDAGRRMVMSFKHGDRTDLALPAAHWMIRAGAAIFTDDLLVAPVPLHRLRLLKRRFNQSALLSQAVAQLRGLDHCPNLVLRHRSTPSQKGRGIEARFSNLNQAFKINPKHVDLVRNRGVLLVDDVMTSGATLATVAEVCQEAGCADVRILTLARAVLED